MKRFILMVGFLLGISTLAMPHGHGFYGGHGGEYARPYAYAAPARPCILRPYYVPPVYVRSYYIAWYINSWGKRVYYRVYY